MESFNNIGISNELDWKRIRKLFVIGIIAACMVFVGDWLLGYGTADKSLTGIERELSAYITMSDRRIFWSSILGFIGIPLEGLCYFGIYRLIAPKSEKYAHMLRSGILGNLIFGGCGVHVPCLAAVYIYKYMLQASPETALEVSERFGAYFLLPGTLMLIVSVAVMAIAQISAFAKGLTPYPKWCWIFSMPVGLAITFLFDLFGDKPWANALTAAWMSFANLWMFCGLLIMSYRLKDEKAESSAE